MIEDGVFYHPGQGLIASGWYHERNEMGVDPEGPFPTKQKAQDEYDSYLDWLMWREGM